MNKFPVFLILAVAACSPSRQTITTVPAAPSSIVVDGKLFTSLFQQKAAEYRALCIQAYNLARMQLDASLKLDSDKPRAIITDVDETVLDNSPYAVARALQGLDYEAQSWYDWTSKAIADTLAGAYRFFKYAQEQQVQVFYVTNRDENERSSTLKNLERFGLPFADSDHLFMKKSTSSKEERRNTLMEKFNVILLVGDNLADFSSFFDKKSSEERNTAVNLLSSEFGRRFILLPNPVYGDWETSLYRYNYALTPAQKDSVVRSVTKGY